MGRMVLVQATCSSLCTRRTQISLFPWNTISEAVLEEPVDNMANLVMVVLEVEVVRQLPGNAYDRCYESSTDFE